MPETMMLSSGPQSSRRAFLKQGTLCLAGFSATSLLAADQDAKPSLRVGLVTDLHYADKPARINRFYRETPAKLTEAIQRFKAEQPAFVVELGDLIDQAESVEQEMAWLETIEKHFAQVGSNRHYVLGNHCVTTLTKAEFAAQTKASRKFHYSFEKGGFHFVILDSCFRSDGEPYQRNNSDWTDANIPAHELEWLRSDLAKARKPVVVFVHQRLDEAGKHSVRNAAAVRAEFEKSGRVLAVFQGHSHKNDYQQIGGIHYCTLVAMVEGSGPDNSGYAMLDLMRDGSLRVRGFRRQVNRDLLRGA